MKASNVSCDHSYCNESFGCQFLSENNVLCYEYINQGHLSQCFLMEPLFNKKGKRKKPQIHCQGEKCKNATRITYDRKLEKYVVSIWCLDHKKKCLKCERRSLVNKSQYCKVHCCPKCSRIRPEGRVICDNHYCNQCHMTIDGQSDFCIDHLCSINDCLYSNLKNWGGNDHYCYRHMCSIKNCQNPKVVVGRFCENHRCSTINCYNQRISDRSYCVTGYCLRKTILDLFCVMKAKFGKSYNYKDIRKILAISIKIAASYS